MLLFAASVRISASHPGHPRRQSRQRLLSQKALRCQSKSSENECINDEWEDESYDLSQPRDELYILLGSFSMGKSSGIRTCGGRC